MKRFILVSALLCTAVLLAGQTLAQTLDLVPSYQTVKLGDEAVVCLHCSGLTPGTVVDPAVGAFDIDVMYWDPDNILKFKKAVIGPQLGDPADSTETSLSVVDFDGFVWVAEHSSLLPAELNALQGRAVTLVCLTFKANKEGSVNIGGDLYSVDDQFGNILLGAQGPVGLATVEVVKKKKDLLPKFP